MAEEMRSSTFWILLALAGGRRHGYAIIEEVRTLSDGRFVLKVPTLYAALDRLSRDGLVLDDGEEAVGGRLRRYFRITDEGTAQLAAEATRMVSDAQTARQRLALVRPDPPARARMA